MNYGKSMYCNVRKSCFFSFLIDRLVCVLYKSFLNLRIFSRMVIKTLIIGIGYEKSYKYVILLRIIVKFVDSE